jgi:hypothetical protein
MKWLLEIAREVATWDPITQGFLALALCACVYSCEAAATRARTGPTAYFWVDTRPPPAPTPATPPPEATR